MPRGKGIQIDLTRRVLGEGESKPPTRRAKSLIEKYRNKRWDSLRALKEEHYAHLIIRYIRNLELYGSKGPYKMFPRGRGGGRNQAARNPGEWRR